MAQLPVYRQQGNITTDTPARIRDLDTYAQGAINMQKAGNALQELAARWQESKDAVENLDGRNKLNSGITAILDEAANFNEYSTPEELNQKQEELTQRMNNLVPDIVSGFSNNQKAREFEMKGQFATQQNIYKLQGIFRDKQIDMGRAGLITSQQTNMENFIATGNPLFKETYLNDLDSMLQNGIVDREYAAKMKTDTDKWDVYHVMRQAESDPEAVIQNLKEGNYNIKPEYYHDLLENVTKIKSNKQIIDDYENALKQNDYENEALTYIYGDASYDDKDRYLAEMQLQGKLSDSFAADARRVLKFIHPAGGKNESAADALDEVLTMASDLNEDEELSDMEYLSGVKNIRDEINRKVESGEITAQDGTRIINKLQNSTKKRTSKATSEFAQESEFKAAKDYIDKTLPAQLRSTAIRDVFYNTANLDTSNMSPTEIKQRYYNAAVKAVQNINAKNRNQALQITRPAQKGDTWQGHTITSMYGKRQQPIKGASTDHKGIDLSYKNNETINAFAGGKVVKVVNNQGNSKKGYGNYVDIKSYDGTIHRYAHANKITVKVGQEIEVGKPIAKAGSTGYSTGPHLHYEKIVNGNRINPLGNQRGSGSMLANNSNISEGSMIRNPKTGKTMVLKGGKWQVI